MHNKERAGNLRRYATVHLEFDNACMNMDFCLDI